MGECSVTEELVTGVKESFAVILKELEDLYEHVDLGAKNEVLAETGEINAAKNNGNIRNKREVKDANVGARYKRKDQYEHEEVDGKDIKVDGISSDRRVIDEVKNLEEIEQNLKEIIMSLDSP